MKAESDFATAICLMRFGGQKGERITEEGAAVCHAREERKKELTMGLSLYKEKQFEK